MPTDTWAPIRRRRAHCSWWDSSAPVVLNLARAISDVPSQCRKPRAWGVYSSCARLAPIRRAEGTNDETGNDHSCHCHGRARYEHGVRAGDAHRDRRNRASACGGLRRRVAYEQIAGRAFGELDPRAPVNAIIQDIELGEGRRRQSALRGDVSSSTKPVDMTRGERPDVARRAEPRPRDRDRAVAERDVRRHRRWPARGRATTPAPPRCGPTRQRSAATQWLQVPVARRTGRLARSPARCSGASSIARGPASQPLIVQTNPVPYMPVSLDTTQVAARVARRRDHARRRDRRDGRSAPTDWAWAHVRRRQAVPRHARPDADLPEERLRRRPSSTRSCSPRPTRTCSASASPRGATSASFFKTARGRRRAARPIRSRARHAQHRRAASRSRATSCAAGCTSASTRTKTAAQVHDGMWPIIAGRRIALNFRWAQPDGVLELYQAGSEGPQWWLPHPRPGARPADARASSIAATRPSTCPKIIEHFGSAEVWALKLTPEWVGTDAQVPTFRCPTNVRRYYIASSQPRRRRRRLRHQPARRRRCRRPGRPARATTTASACCRPIRCRTPQTVNALRVHFRDWVMKGTPPPPSRYPTLARRHAGAPPTRRRSGFRRLPRSATHACPSRTSSCRCSITTGVRSFNPSTARASPRTRRRASAACCTMLAPKVDADGNELGGVPVVLLDAPLGTYLGWNITAGGAGLPQGPDLQLRRRHDSVREDRRERRPTAIRDCRSKSATAITMATWRRCARRPSAP